MWRKRRCVWREVCGDVWKVLVIWCVGEGVSVWYVGERVCQCGVWVRVCQCGVWVRVCQCGVWVRVCVMWYVCLAENEEEGVLM